MEDNSPPMDRIKERLAIMAEQPENPYFIRYRIQTGRYGKDDAGEDEGLTQDLILVSCITQPNGGYSQLWNATNGATGGPLHHDDVFKAWIMMASSLREKEDLAPWKRDFINDVFEE